MKTKISSRYLLIAATSILLLKAEVFAHANGVSKITLNFDSSDSLFVTVDVNRDDVFNSVDYGGALTQNMEANREKLEEMAAYYLRSRLSIEVDEKNFNNSMALISSVSVFAPQTKQDTAAFQSNTYIMKFASGYDTSATRLKVQVQYFAEFGIQPLSEVIVQWKGQEAYSAWLNLDKVAKWSLIPDTLKSRIEQRRLAALPGGGGIKNEGGGFTNFILHGFTHILPKGLDHILFVLGLFFFSTLMRPLLLQITAFTLAHSITLALSLVGIVNLSPQIVEPLIAISIVVVAIENIFYRKMRPSRWLIVFAFGLIHGMGFAGVLKDIGLPSGEFWSTLIGFNIGVELGQLTVIGLATAATVWFWNKPWYFRRVVVPASSGIALVGLYWAVQRITGWG